MYRLRRKIGSKSEQTDETEKLEMETSVAIDADIEVNTSEKINDTENVNEIGHLMLSYQLRIQNRQK